MQAITNRPAGHYEEASPGNLAEIFKGLVSHMSEQTSKQMAETVKAFRVATLEDKDANKFAKLAFGGWDFKMFDGSSVEAAKDARAWRAFAIRVGLVGQFRYRYPEALLNDA